MSLHDAYARRTPYELVFGDVEEADALQARVAEEAGARGVDDADPHSFVTLGAVAAFVTRLAGPEAPHPIVHRFGALLYHAVHFARAGRPLYFLSTHAARYLVEGVPDGAPEPIARAGYLQLPQHLFWADGAGGTPESVDGVFWTASDAGVLHALLVTGMRPDRAGFDVAPLPEAPIAEAAAWMGAEVREGEADFSSVLPGSELDGLYAFQAAGEVLKLLARFFAYAASVPDALLPGEEPGGKEGPAPTELPFTRVELHA